MFEGLCFNHWKATLDEDGIVLLGMDRARNTVNAISHAMLEELAMILERLEIDTPKGVIVYSAKASSFAVGADITEFAEYEKQGRVLANIEYGQSLYTRINHLSCPVIAAIDGPCLGGGAELALACHSRVATSASHTRIGFPEVQLGIHPGWGGTVRLPRLIGAPLALQHLLSGRTFSADKAHVCGLVDDLVTQDKLLDQARKIIHSPRKRTNIRQIKAKLSNSWLVRQMLAPFITRKTAMKVRSDHYPAPFAIIDIWQRGGKNIKQQLKREAHSVDRLAQSPTARELIRLFFLQEKLKNQSRQASHAIECVHVIGAGVMGGDIAAWCAWKGFTTTLEDREQAAVETSLARANKLFGQKSRNDKQQWQAAKARLSADLQGKNRTSADLIIEAIVENKQAKQTLYAELESTRQRNSILVSNTSSIPLEALQENLAQPECFAGLHFFNPVEKMPLVEVIKHSHWSESTQNRLLAFCHALNKLPVVVKGTPGFLVNRILMPYLLEAMTLYNEGIDKVVIDHAARQFGMPVGPLELADTVGLDVCTLVGKELAPFLGLDDIPVGLDQRIEAGQRGKKDGQGFYTWDNNKAQKSKISKNKTVPDDVTDRLILPMLNEAVACLNEEVIDTPDLLDAGIVFGTGFAPFRGGPIRYIQCTGAETLRKRLETLEANHKASRFKPCLGWDHPALLATKGNITT